MVQDITERSLSASQAGAAHGVSAVTARKWLGRYLAAGAAGLCDKSSRPACSPRAIAPATALAIVELRRQLYGKDTLKGIGRGDAIVRPRKLTPDKSASSCPWRGDLNSGS